MYAIAALVYVIFAGQPVDEPLLVRHKDTFLTQEACQDFLKSDAFGVQREVLTERVRTALMEMRTQAAADDQPLPTVAITASCEKDPRV